MNFADPQTAISTLVDRDGGFDAYSVVVAGAGLHHGTFDDTRAAGRAHPKLTKVHDTE
jgi:hypothetical protein